MRPSATMRAPATVGGLIDAAPAVSGRFADYLQSGTGLTRVEAVRPISARCDAGLRHAFSETIRASLAPL